MRRLVRFLVVLCVLLVVAGGLLVWRLDQGPVSLALVQPLLQRLIDRGSPFRVTFTAPTLRWSRADGTLALGLGDLEVRTAEGEFIAGAPSARITVAAAPLLLGWQVEPVAVVLDLPELELTRQTDHSLVLAFAGQLTAFPLSRGVGGGGLEALLGDAAPRGGDSGLEHLRRVRVTAPSLQFYDERTGQRVSADDAAFQLRRHDAGGWAVSLSGRVGGGRVELTGEPGGSAAELLVGIGLERFPVQSLAGIVPDLPLGALELPVSGRIDFPLDTGTRELGVAQVRLAAERPVLALPDIGLDPVRLREAALEMRLAAGWREAAIQELRLAGEGYGLAASGSVAYAGSGPSARLEIEAQDLDVPEILALWPTRLAAPARAWAVENLRRGRIAEARLEVGGEGSHPDRPALGGGFAFSDGELRYLPTLPPATGLAGSASFAGDSLELTLGGGHTGEVALGAGKVVLSGLTGPKEEQLAAELELRSTVSAALRLLEAPPIALGKATGIAPQATSGQQTTRLEVSLPLRDDLEPDQIRYKARTRLSELAIRDVRPGYSLGSGSLVVTAEPSLVEAKGSLQVNGVPLELSWRESPGATKRPQREIAVTGRADKAAAQALGFAWPEPLAGSLGVEARLSEAKHPLRTIDLVLDLQQLGIGLPELMIAKQPGQPGKATARLVQPEAASLAVERFRVELPGTTAAGAAGLRLDPLRPERLALRELRTPLGDLTADLALQRNVWRGRIDVGRLDLRPVLQGTGGQQGGAGEGSRLPDLALDLAAGSLRLGDAPFSDLAGTVERSGGIWRSARLNARIEDSQVTLDLGTQGGVSALTLRSNDAGWLIRGFAATDNGVRGGQFRLSADLRQGGPALSGKGELKIRGFTLWGAPMIARIVSLASFSGLGNALSGKGVPVDRLVVPFALDGDRLLLQQARLVGSDIGARADGTIDLAADRIDLSGTVAPAYTINRLLGSIPILGQILSGSRSDAAIAATFSVKGPLEEPSVTVNPLAALVPGLVRDLFNALTADTGPEAAPLDQR
jgi:hypothetical protein